ncbi:MAG: hypothetical protein M0D54_07810 [Hyphomonadaceae bacterium JAD_PAG50586_4]|nr:MAG: hypothetical protein M0D54_07810 [Hyphomonadaceae bacterium JAD_PAG50586_4]
MSSCVCAFTENGTSWIELSRLVAVTMMVSSSDVCANALLGVIADMATANAIALTADNQSFRLVFILSSLSRQGGCIGRPNPTLVNVRLARRVCRHKRF